ncbi:MAG TPA: hypothetical protein VKA15_14355 [Isosphaeraceae bacterium]|nr:hypothetical protein [Isosphaeraceae bacterium]
MANVLIDPKGNIYLLSASRRSATNIRHDVITEGRLPEAEYADVQIGRGQMTPVRTAVILGFDVDGPRETIHQSQANRQVIVRRLEQKQIFPARRGLQSHTPPAHRQQDRTELGFRPVHPSG